MSNLTPPPSALKSQHSLASYHSTAPMVDDSECGEAVVDYAFFYTRKFKICFLAMCLNVVLFALDQFIIVTAVPQIVSQFDALDKIEWLNTAFFIPCAGASLIYTQIMTVADPRWTYLLSIVVFEAGSAICGAASSMNMLIVGRAVAGAGGSGMWAGTYLIGTDLIPFGPRATYFGLYGLSYIFASIAGPLVGGAFTDMSSSGWRWCFYINLPIGGLTLGLLFLTIPSIPKLLPFDARPDTRPLWLRLLRVDWTSAILTVGFVTCLGTGLQWGGVTKSWNDAGVIITLVLALVLFLALVGWSFFMGNRAMVPMSLFKSRHFSAGCWVSFLGYGAIVVYLYYLPLYFEAIKNKPATRAGVLLLALQLTMCPMLVVCGKLGEKTGQAKYLIIAGSCLVTVASGLLTILKPLTSIGTVIGFQIIAGFGFGMILNAMVILVQSKFLRDAHMVTHATNVFNFWGFIGRIITMSTATNIFNNKLHMGLGKITALSDTIDAEVAAAPKAIWTALPESLRGKVLNAYCSALVKVFWLALACSIACLISALLMENINLRTAAEDAKIAKDDGSSSSYPMQTSPGFQSEDKLND